ncbi:hypothetical protein Pmani_031811 [Petrolisthes manimaculis]|uniref:RecA family profile 1 domain-containing protein n=1 Tax=Petrolisthes manimaculis TaxID=1843537 RepID=A0AAE1NUB7_9EUCA|nr:hypothetical protein Pmani_031811 [Petrolisthes manimaculis]
MRLTAGMCPALTQDVIEKLKECNIKNILDFMKTDPEALAMKASISYRDLCSIRRVIIAHSAAFVVRGEDLLKEAITATKVIPTGTAELDRVLGGGVLTGEVVELCGGWGVGKSSLCVTLATHAALHLGLSVLYIDPLNSISALRFTPVIEKLSEDAGTVEEALSRIKVESPADVWGLLKALDLVKQPYLSFGRFNTGGCNRFNSNNPSGKIKLVILDSLASILTPLFIGSTKQELGMINQLAAALKSLACEQEVAILVVNNVVQADYGKRRKRNDMYDEWKPALGRFWESVPHTRLFIQRLPNSIRQHTKELPTSHAQNMQDSMTINISVWKSTRLKQTVSMKAQNPEVNISLF